MIGINPVKRTSERPFSFLDDGNAAGPDGTPAEAKKADVNTPHSPNVLHKTIGQSGRREQVHRRGLTTHKNLQDHRHQQRSALINPPPCSSRRTGAIDRVSLTVVYEVN